MLRIRIHANAKTAEIAIVACDVDLHIGEISSLSKYWLLIRSVFFVHYEIYFWNLTNSLALFSILKRLIFYKSYIKRSFSNLMLLMFIMSDG